jgi:hypothetical protein
VGKEKEEKREETLTMAAKITEMPGERARKIRDYAKAWQELRELRKLEAAGASEERLRARMGREANAKLSYGIWAHRTSAAGVPWERPPEPHRQAWREVIEFIQSDVIEERDLTCALCAQDLVCVNRGCELYEGGPV